MKAKTNASEKVRRRYLLISGEKEEIEKTILDYLGILGFGKARPVFIEKKGEGMHHIAFDVDDIEAEMKRLKMEGFVLLNEIPKKGADNKLVCFIHPKNTSGVLIELCQEIPAPQPPKGGN